MPMNIYILVWIISIIVTGKPELLTQVHTNYQQTNILQDGISPFMRAATLESMYLNYARLEPLVVRQGVDYFNLQLGVDISIVGVSVEYGGIGYKGKFGEPIKFYDDGSHGDKLAGDKIFTSDSISTYPQGKPVQEFSIPNAIIFYELADGSFVTSTEPLPVSVRTIDPVLVKLPTVWQVEEDVYATDHVFNVILPDVIGLFPQQTLGDLQRDPTNPSNAIYHRYYDIMPDDRDFLIYQRMIGYMNATGTYLPVSNNIVGIGEELFNSAKEYGSGARLQGIISINLQGNSFEIYNHEMLHRWGVYLDPSLGFGIAHWGAIERPSSGFGPGNSFYSPIIIPESESMFLAQIDPEDNFSFNDIELYLMGLIEPGDVSSPLRTLVNRGPLTDVVQADNNYYFRVSADSLREVKMTEIINKMGQRVPSTENSQKQFSTTFLIPYDRPLSSVEFAFFEYLMREYEAPDSELGFTFENATGYRANLVTSLSLPSTANSLPEISNFIPDIELLAGDDGFIQELNNVFIDVDGDQLSFFTSSGNEAIATTTVSNNMIVVTALAPGSTTITVSADDGHGHSVQDQFEVEVLATLYVEQITDELPSSYNLSQNYPNPFNQVTTIIFDLPKQSSVSLKIYNILGREIFTLASGNFAAGRFEVLWDATDFPDGLYIYRLEAGIYRETRKLILRKK